MVGDRFELVTDFYNIMTLPERYSNCHHYKCTNIKILVTICHQHPLSKFFQPIIWSKINVWKIEIKFE